MRHYSDAISSVIIYLLFLFLERESERLVLDEH